MAGGAQSIDARCREAAKQPPMARSAGGCPAASRQRASQNFHDEFLGLNMKIT